MEYNMNMYAKLLHTSISRVSYEGNVVKIYGNLTDFHITYVVKKYREECKHSSLILFTYLHGSIQSRILFDDCSNTS